MTNRAAILCLTIGPGIYSTKLKKTSSKSDRLLDGLLDLRAWRADDDRVLDEQGDYRPPHGLLVVSLVYGDLLTQRHYGDDEGRQGKPEYLVTSFVAEAAHAFGFAGILCASVRHPAENLVVFDPNWCPKELGEPVSVTLDENAMRLRENYFWNQGVEGS